MVSDTEMVLCGANNLLENGKLQKYDKCYEKRGTGSHGIALALYGRGVGMLIRKEWRTGLDAVFVQLVTYD